MEYCTGAGQDWDQGVSEMVARFPHREREIRLFSEGWHETVSGTIAQSVNVLDALIARGEAVYAITNFSALRWAECQQRFPFLTNFTDAVVSAHEKLVKPDPAIFEVLLNRNSLKAENCIFIDDSAANIATANSMGFSTVHFSAKTKLVEEL